MCWKCLLRSWWKILPVFALLCYFAIQNKLPDIEADLQSRVAENTNVSGLNDIVISFHNQGRIGKLMGTVESLELRNQAVALTQATYGVAGIVDQVAVVESVNDDLEHTEPVIAGRLLLDGVVSSLAERELLVAIAVKQFGVNNVVDNIVISGAVSPAPWFGKLVNRLDVGNGLRTISVEGDNVTVTGVVGSEALREKVLEDIRIRVGNSYQVIDDITVQAPI